MINKDLTEESVLEFFSSLKPKDIGTFEVSRGESADETIELFYRVAENNNLKILFLRSPSPKKLLFELRK